MWRWSIVIGCVCMGYLAVGCPSTTPPNETTNEGKADSTGESQRDKADGTVQEPAQETGSEQNTKDDAKDGGTADKAPENAAEPAPEPTPEPTKETTPEPKTEPTPEPVAEKVPEAGPEPTKDTQEPVSEPVSEPTPDKAPEKVPETGPEPLPEGNPSLGFVFSNIPGALFNTLTSAGWKSAAGGASFDLWLSDRPGICQLPQLPAKPYHYFHLSFSGGQPAVKQYAVGSGLLKADLYYDDGSGPKKMSSSNGGFQLQTINGNQLSGRFTFQFTGGVLQGSVNVTKCP